MEKKLANIEAKSLLAMCYILDDYERLKNGVEELNKKSTNWDYIFQVTKLIQGKKTFVSREAKKFYNDYYDVIETINKYGYFYNFVMSNFCWGDEAKLGSEYCYEYLKANVANLEVIKEVLKRIVALGIEKIDFDTSVDFSKETYSVYTDRFYSTELNYLANMKSVPIYQKNKVEYITTNSPYKITLSTSLGQIEKYGRKIILNSLVFSPLLLPEEINHASIYSELTALKESTKEERTVITNSVDISIAIEDLYGSLAGVLKIIETISNEETKMVLKKSADKIITELDQMSKTRDNFEKKSLNDHPELTEEKLTLEKKLYKDRREEAKIDYC